MSYRFEGMGGEFQLSVEAWGTVLALAEASGWKPEGTRPPEPIIANWPGSYNAQRGQRVSDEDALSLADALQELSSEIRTRETADPPEGLDDATIERFAMFCRMGGFSIKEA